MSAPHNHIYRWHSPDPGADERPGVYLLHGTGEHAERYEHLAQRLVALGFHVAAHDHPGHGRAPGKRGVIDPPGSLVTQAAIQCQSFAQELGRSPIVFGHSLGGVVATELVLQHAMPVAGLILSAPAFVPYIRKRDRFQVRALQLFAPTFTVERPYDATRLTHDKSVQEIAHNDALNHGYKSASLIAWLIDSGQQQLQHAHRLSVDTLVLIAGADPVVRSDKIQEFVQSAPADKIKAINYDGFLHEILNETPDRSMRAFADIEQWLSERFINT